MMMVADSSGWAMNTAVLSCVSGKLMYKSKELTMNKGMSALKEGLSGIECDGAGQTGEVVG